MVETYHTVIVEESINNGYIVCAKNNENAILERVTSENAILERVQSVAFDNESIGLRVEGEAQFDAAGKRMEVDIVTITEPTEKYEEAQISFA